MNAKQFKCKCGFKTQGNYCPNCGSWISPKTSQKIANQQKAAALFNRLVRKAKKGHLEEDEDGYTDTVFEASLGITGKANLLKIPTDLGLENDECKKDILEFITEIKTSQGKDDYFGLSICYDIASEGEPTFQIILLANNANFYPIMITPDQTRDIIKRLFDACLLK